MNESAGSPVRFSASARFCFICPSSVFLPLLYCDPRSGSALISCIQAHPRPGDWTPAQLSLLRTLAVFSAIDRTCLYISLLLLLTQSWSSRSLYGFFQWSPLPTSDGAGYSCFKHAHCYGNTDALVVTQQSLHLGNSAEGRKCQPLCGKVIGKAEGASGHLCFMAPPVTISGTFLFLPIRNWRERNTTSRLCAVALNPYGILGPEIWLKSWKGGVLCFALVIYWCVANYFNIQRFQTSTEILSHNFCDSGVWECLPWVVLAQDCPQSRGQYVNWSCRHLKIGPELWVSRGLTHRAGKSVQAVSGRLCGPLHAAAGLSSQHAGWLP